MKYEKPGTDGLLNVNILHAQNTRLLHQRYLMDTLKNKGPVMEYGRGNILK